MLLGSLEDFLGNLLIAYHPPCHSMSPSEPSVTLGGVASASTRKLGCVTRTRSRACVVMRPCKCCQRQEEMKRTPSYRVTSRSWQLQLEAKQAMALSHIIYKKIVYIVCPSWKKLWRMYVYSKCTLFTINLPHKSFRHLQTEIRLKISQNHRDQFPHSILSWSNGASALRVIGRSCCRPSRTQRPPCLKKF